MASEIPTRQIQDFLSERQGEMVDFLRELVIAESPSTDPESQRRPFRILRQVLEGLDYSIKLLPGKQSGGILTARPTQSAIDQSQLLLGHCDTVWPVGTLEQMPVQLVDGRLSGPGVARRPLSGRGSRSERRAPRRRPT